MTIEQQAADCDHVHISSQKAADRFCRSSDDGFVFIQRSVKDDWHSRLRMEPTDQSVIQRIRPLRHSLQTTAAVDMSHRRNDRMFLGPNRKHLFHVRRRFTNLEPIPDVFFQNARGKRAEFFAKFDPQIDDVPHVCASGVRQQSAIAKCSSSKLHRPLKPSHNIPVNHQIRHAIDKARVIQQLIRQASSVRRRNCLIVGR